MAGLSTRGAMTWNGSRWVPAGDQNTRPITGYQGQQPVYGESPMQAQTRQQQEQRNAQETANRQTQTMANEQLEQTRLTTDAMRQANSQAWQMSGNNNIPRSVTGTTMTIGDGGGGGSTRRTGSGGGGDFNFESIMKTIERLGGGNQSPRVDLEEPPQSRTDPSLAFSRAKDVAGRSANKALEALKDVMSSRGLGASGYESAGGAQILGDTARYITDADYQAAMADDNRNWEAKKTRYSGSIQQRGQDANSRQAMLSLLPTILNYSRSY